MRLFYLLYSKLRQVFAAIRRRAESAVRTLRSLLHDSALKAEVESSKRRLAGLEAELYRTRAAAAGTSAAISEWVSRYLRDVDALALATSTAHSRLDSIESRMARFEEVGQETLKAVASLRQLEPAVAGLSGALLELRNVVRADAERCENGFTQILDVTSALAGKLAVVSETSSRNQDSLTLYRAELEGLRESISRISSETSEVRARMDTTNENLSSFATKATANIEGLRESISLISSETSEVLARIEVTDEKVSTLADKAAANEKTVTSIARETGRIQSPSFDSFYLDFENHFRGSQEDIVAKMRDYLPVVVSCAAGTSDAPILDLGCGRGEWLQVLTESGLSAQGHDLSTRMVEECLKKGLVVAQGDALERLRSSPADSFGAISAFHLVEHLPLATLLEFLEESFRALRPGGILILETPNPQNVIVGACNFYIDPTHRNPIPPMTLRFMLERLGFASVQVIPKHPFSEINHFSHPRTSTEDRLNDFFFGAQDYAVLAQKRL